MSYASSATSDSCAVTASLAVPSYPADTRLRIHHIGWVMSTRAMAFRTCAMTARGQERRRQGAVCVG